MRRQPLPASLSRMSPPAIQASVWNVFGYFVVSNATHPYRLISRSEMTTLTGSTCAALGFCRACRSFGNSRLGSRLLSDFDGCTPCDTLQLGADAPGSSGARQRERWQFYDRASFERRFVGANSHARPVGRLYRIGIRVAIIDERRNEFVHQMRMGTAMSASLRERQMRVLGQIVDPLGGKHADCFRQAVGVVGHLDALRDFVLGLLGGVQDRILPLDELPFEGLFRAVHVETLAILPG